jgi:hypothetical protein
MISSQYIFNIFVKNFAKTDTLMQYSIQMPEHCDVTRIMS